MSDLFLTPEYLLLQRMHALLSLIPVGEIAGGSALLEEIQARLAELRPTLDPLEPEEANLYVCEFCLGALHVRREIEEQDTIAIDGETGGIIWASTSEETFAVADHCVVCSACGRISTRVRYDRLSAGLVLLCSNCGGECREEGGVWCILVDASGVSRAICTLDCEQSFRCEP